LVPLLWSGARKRGLADVKVDGDIIIAYVAKPGDSALDLPTITGADVSTGNGPHAQSVARFIAEGLKHTDFFQQGRAADRRHAADVGERQLFGRVLLFTARQHAGDARAGWGRRRRTRGS
jgi:hypothetical protein